MEPDLFLQEKKMHACISKVSCRLYVKQLLLLFATEEADLLYLSDILLQHLKNLSLILPSSLIFSVYRSISTHLFLLPCYSDSLALRLSAFLTLFTVSQHWRQHDNLVTAIIICFEWGKQPKLIVITRKIGLLFSWSITSQKSFKYLKISLELLPFLQKRCFTVLLWP